MLRIIMCGGWAAATLLISIGGCGSQDRASRQALMTGEQVASTPPPLARVDFETSVGAETKPNEAAVDASERFERIVENPFVAVESQPLSTFSIDVDTASYSKVRQYLVQYNQLPRPDAVRIEELLNYFRYDYPPPSGSEPHPFATHVDVAACPWNPNHRLARVAVQGRELQPQRRPPCSLVLLIDSSGSMGQPNKLPLLKRGIGLLVQQLSANDRIAVVAYAGSAGLVLESTAASQRELIRNALDRLDAGGPTNGGEGLQLAYATARDQYVEGGVNRVLLCTDGDFNVGQSGTDQLMRLIESEADSGIELTVLGFGMGNLNDAMLEAISGRGNGNYAFIDTIGEARKVLVEQLAGTLVTIAKDVKIQLEFNPAQVAAYRLLGYENRIMAAEDFSDDRKDAGEIGAGHSVTALYEIIPVAADTTGSVPQPDPLKYQQPAELSVAAESGELMTVKLRYKLPGEAESRLIKQGVFDSGLEFDQADSEFQFAAAVAGFGMLLRDSRHRGDWTFDAVADVARGSLGRDDHGLRREFLDLVAVAQSLQGR